MEPTIRLDQALKLLGLADTGGQAKLLVQSGAVLVNGTIETRRGHKLHAGDTIALKSAPERIHTVPALAP